MDFQNNNNYVSWPKRNKLWLCLPSIPTNCEAYREPLPGASSLMVTDNWNFRANKISPSCLSNRVKIPSSIVFKFQQHKKLRTHPSMVSHRLQLFTYSLHPILWVTKFHCTWTNYYTKSICYISLTHCLRTELSRVSISSKNELRNAFKSLYTPSTPQIIWQTMLWCVCCLGAGAGSRAESPQSDKHSLSSLQPQPRGEWMGKCTICAWVTAVEPATDRLMVIS